MWFWNSEHESEISEHDSEIPEHNSEISEHDSEISEHNSEISDCASEISEYHSQIPESDIWNQFYSTFESDILHWKGFNKYPESNQKDNHNSILDPEILDPF